MHRIRILRIPKSFRIRQIAIFANPNLNRDFWDSQEWESHANPNGIISPMRMPCESVNPANPKIRKKNIRLANPKIRTSLINVYKQIQCFTNVQRSST